MDETASHSQAESELTPQPLRLAPPLPQPLPVTILQSFSPPKQERTLLHDYSNIYMDSSGEEDSIPAPLSATMPSMTRMSPGDDTLGRRTPTNRTLELPSLSHASATDFRRPRASSSPRERPPMSEVLLNPEIEPNENDTFSEEPSLEPKVRRSLNLTPATPPRMSTPRRNFYRRTHPPSISPGTKQSPDSDKNVNGASPAWMRIKNDLQSSNEKLGKVEKENVKLAETCKSLTEELRRMSESADQIQSLQDEVKNLKRAMDLLSHQNKQLSKEKRALMFGARQLEEEKELLDEARLAAERSEMNVIEDFHDMEEKIVNLEEELKAMKEDRDRIATELEQSIQSKLVMEQEKTEMVIRMHSVNDEAVQSSPPTEAAAPTTASKAETTLRRKGELQKREIAQLRSALDEERNRCKELEESSVEYKSEAQTLKKEVEALKREVSNLKNALYDPQASNGAGAFHEDQENRNNDLEEANNLMKLEIVQLTAELEDANLQAQTLERSASRADTEIQSLLEDNDSLRTEVAQMTAHLRDTAAECDKLKNEINILQGDRDSLQQQVQELQQSIASKSASSTEMGTQTDYSLEPASPQRQRQNTGSPSVSSLSERIDRIRDSAERATLIRDHQREMLRVRKEHEAEVSKLRAEHDSLIRRLAKEAKAEMDIRNKDLQRRLEAEYETKMSDLARHHEKEVARLHEDLKNSSLNAEESVQAAMSKVASTMQRLERETKRREALEQTLDQIHVEHNAEYQKILEMHRQELELLREEWEEDKNSLLSIVQSECNLVFDRNKALNRASISRSEQRRTPSSRHTAEKSAISRRASTRTDTASTETNKAAATPTSSSNGESLLSQINRDLLETENLVNDLVGGGAPITHVTTE